MLLEQNNWFWLIPKHSWEIFFMEPSEDLFPRMCLIFLRFCVPNLDNYGGPISRIFVSSFLRYIPREINFENVISNKAGDILETKILQFLNKC